MLVYKALPMGAEPKKHRFGDVLLFCLCSDDPLSLDDAFHETAIARYRLIERVMILFQVRFFHVPSSSG